MLTAATAMRSDLKFTKTVLEVLSGGTGLRIPRVSCAVVLVLLLAVMLPYTTAQEEFDYGHFGKDWHGACATGAAQSPINIVTADAIHEKSKNEYYLEYDAASELVIYNTGHCITLKLSNTSNNFFYTPEGKFRLTQFHFHVFSEHSVNGLFAPMEIHFVHVNANNSHISVVGIRGRLHPRDKDNSFLNKFFQYIHNETRSHDELTLDIKQFLQPRGSKPSVLNHYSYPGSLTTPPCSEVVTWYVLKRRVKISLSQMLKIVEADAAIKEANRFNDRLPVLLGNRRLTFRELF